MGYQFLHIESYARSAGKGKAGGHSIASILAEAKRDAGACPHVDKPVHPVLLFGCSLQHVEAQAVKWAAGSLDASGRRLRKDGLCLLSGVVSAPDDMSDADWSSMKQDAIEWLNRDGRLISVVEHVDESHRHIHFYKVPRPGERFDVLHPGRLAAAEAKAKGLVKGQQNQAYKKAMRGLQDDFFEKVGVRYGLTRFGPGRRRLSRSEWHADQASMAAVAKAMAIAGEATAEMEKAKAIALELASKAKADADKAQVEIQKMEKAKLANVSFVKKWKSEKAETEARLMQTEAKLKRLSTWGERLGAFIGKVVDGVVGAFTGRKAREAKQSQALRMAIRELKAAKDQIEQEQQRTAMARLEKDAAAIHARNELKAVAAQLDAANAVFNQVNTSRPGGIQGGKMRP